MPKLLQLALPPEKAADGSAIRKIAASLSGINPSEISFLRILRRSVDARKRKIIINLAVEIFTEKDVPFPAIAPLRIRM